MKKSGLTKAIIRANALKTLALVAILFFVSLSPARPAGAQASGPTYIIQPGDTLWTIALQFGVSLDELKAANGFTDASVLRAGDSLIIPGMQGVTGVLTTKKVGFGENLTSLSRRYGVPAYALVRLNHITIPSELYAGSTLIIPVDGGEKQTPGKRASLGQGQTLLELAALNNVDPWIMSETNEISGTWEALPGDVLRLPGEDTGGPGALPVQIGAIKLTPLAPLQGTTASISINASDGISLTGRLNGRTFHFFPSGDGKYTAMIGINAMLTPGLYPLSLWGTLPNGVPVNFTQQILVKNGGYYEACSPEETINVPEETLDPKNTKPEDDLWYKLAAPATPEKFWSGAFDLPENIFTKEYCLTTNDCWPSYFGTRRSYNGGECTYYHTGLDVFAGVGTKIFAAAPGKVVFAGPLTVRGNAIMIDHGWGVYSAYLHLSEFEVKEGDQVEAGQEIALSGATGRVQGPHLHFEVMVDDVPVEPLDWLQNAYP